LKDLFDYYDVSKDGVLDYKEFTAVLFGQPPPTKKYEKNPRDSVQIENTCSKIKTVLAKRGPGGIIGLGKQFRIADKNRSQTLDRDEFVYGLRDFGTGVSEEEA